MKINKCTFPIFNRISAPKLTNQSQIGYTKAQYQTPSLENLKANYLIGFKGGFGSFISADGKKYNYRTHLFREPKTDEIVQEYVIRRFKNDPNVLIVSGACSTGEEAKSYFMMLNDACRGNLFVSGFDISENIVEEANKNEVQLIFARDVREQHITEGSCCREEFLMKNDTRGLDDYLKKCKNRFDKYFDKEGASYAVQYEGYEGTFYAQKYKAKKGKFGNCTFKPGSVEKLETLYNSNSVNVLLYRNAIYHTLCEAGTRRMRRDAENIMNDIARQMNKILKANGLVVFEEEPQKGLREDIIEKCMANNGFKRYQKMNNVWLKVKDVQEVAKAKETSRTLADRDKRRKMENTHIKSA